MFPAAADFDELLTRALPGLRAYVRLHMGRPLRGREDSQDIVQTVVRQAIEKRLACQFRGEAAFRQWLLTLAQHRMADRARHHRAERRDHRREVTLAATGAEDEMMRSCVSLLTPSRTAIGREQVERFERAFAQLTADDREVILLARIMELPHAAIAAHTGRSQGAVRTALYRALARLAALAAT